MNFSPMITATNNPKGGFTLVEAVVAAALMSLLVAASYIALSSASHAARLMSQRVTAHGMCLTLFEEMKGCVFSAIVSSDAELDDGVIDPVQSKAAFLEAQGIGPGVSDVQLEYYVVPTHDPVPQGLPTANDSPQRKNIRIICSWKFASPFGAVTEGSDLHTETLEGVIVDSFSTSGKKMYLNVNHMELNPNYNAAANSFLLPAYLRITDTAGNVYDQNYLQNHRSLTVNATSVIVYPGGGGEQSGKYSNAPRQIINNAKTYAYYSSSDNDPIQVQISYSGGKYYMNMQCEDASVNIE